MKNILVILLTIVTCTVITAQTETNLTFECLETPFHVDEIYKTTQMFCEDGELIYGDDDPCSDIYYENGFVFYVGRFKHINDDNPIGIFEDIYFREESDGTKYVELLKARMFITTPEDKIVNSVKLEIEDISQNGFIFDYNYPNELEFFNSFEELDDAYPNIHWDGTFLLIDEPVTEFQIGADHLIAKNISVNPSTTTAIQNQPIESKAFAFPNPTINDLNFDLGEDKITSIELFDTQGKVILFCDNIIGGKITISNLIPGTYIARATTPDGKVYIQKVIKL
jgi:hypothetical protein